MPFFLAADNGHFSRHGIEVEFTEGASLAWSVPVLAGGGYDAAAKTQNSATLTIIIALFTLVPAVCYLLSAVIAKRYYTLKTPFLKKMMAELAEGARRNEQDFTAAPIDKEWQN